MPVASVSVPATTLPAYRPAGSVPGIGMRVESVGNAPPAHAAQHALSWTRTSEGRWTKVPESHPQVRDGEGAMPAAQRGEKYDSRVLIAYGSDWAVTTSVTSLYAKHKHNSVVISQVAEECPPRVVAGDPNCLGGRMKLQLVAHCDSAVGQLGLVDANTAAQHIATLCDVVNRTTPAWICKVSAVGCKTGDNSATRSFARRLEKALTERDIHAPVKGYVWDVIVDDDGHKVLIDDDKCFRVDGRRV